MRKVTHARKRTPGRIVTNFCTGVGVHDVITSANFYDCRLWGLIVVRGQNLGFSIDSCECVIGCAFFLLLPILVFASYTKVYDTASFSPSAILFVPINRFQTCLLEFVKLVSDSSNRLRKTGISRTSLGLFWQIDYALSK